MRIITILILALIPIGCRSIDSLPQSAAEANFASGKHGKTKLWTYEDTETFTGVKLKDAMRAARLALLDNGFSVRREADDAIIGSHGTTPNDWNVVAGVYAKEIAEGCQVYVRVHTSKDFGIMGDTTWNKWEKNILTRMRTELK